MARGPGKPGPNGNLCWQSRHAPPCRGARNGGELGHVASGGRVERGSRPPARAESVVVPFPPREPGERLDLVRLVPSGRSLLLAFGLLGAALVLWLVARETGVFGVRTLDVRGATPGIATQVRKALRPAAGESLLKLDVAAAERTVEALPLVESVRFDRAFPHTLRVFVTPERPVAVVRQGARSYLVSARGRVMATIPRTARPRRRRRRRARDRRRRGRAARPLGLSRAGRLRHDDGRRAHAAVALGRARAPRQPGRPAAQAGRRRACAATRPGRHRLPGRLGSGAPGGRLNPRLSGRGRDFDLDYPLRFALTMPTRSPYPGFESHAIQLHGSIRA